MAERQYRTLNKRMVDRLSVDGKDGVFWDRDLPGFGVRVYPSGAEVFVVQSKVPFANGGTRKRTGHRRGSVLARARITLSCATLLARGRRDEFTLGHRVSAWALRRPAHRVVAGIDRYTRIGRKRHDLSSESNMVDFRNKHQELFRTGVPAVEATESEAARFTTIYCSKPIRYKSAVGSLE